MLAPLTTNSGADNGTGATTGADATPTPDSSRSAFHSASPAYGAPLAGRDPVTGYHWTGQFASDPDEPNLITIELPPRHERDEYRVLQMRDAIDRLHGVDSHAVSYTSNGDAIRVRVLPFAPLYEIGNELAAAVAATRLPRWRCRVVSLCRAAARVLRRMADWLAPHDAV